jgi:hypothetical protein
MKVEITEAERGVLLGNHADYYSKNHVLFEICRELQNREFAMLPNKKEFKEHSVNVRFLYASIPDLLKMHLDRLGVLKGSFLGNMYRSVCLYAPNSIPVSTYNLRERTSDPLYKQFVETQISHIIGFDFVLDIDGKSIEDTYLVARRCKSILEGFKVPYYIKPSGTRGWHIIIPSQYLSQEKDMRALIEKVQRVNKTFGAVYDLMDYIDGSVCRPTSLIKCSYSIDGENVSLPLTDVQFNNFNMNMIKYKTVLSNVTFFKRGLLTRTYNLSEQQLKDNVNTFFNEFDYKPITINNMDASK